MKRIIYLIVLAALAASIAGCESVGGGEYEEQIVLQGTYHRDPLRVRLTHSLPMGVQYDPRDVGVPGAVVRITTDTSSYDLVEEPADTAGGGYYSFPDTSVKAIAGGHYRIHVEVETHILDAETVGAGPTEIVSQSRDTVEYGDHTNPLRLQWRLDSLASGYLAIIENVEPDWYEDYRAVSGNNGPDVVPWFFWQVPASDDTLTVPPIAVGFTGRHRIRLMTCDRSLWDYCWTYYPAGQSEVMPVSNVHGGLGVFAVAGVDTTYFVLTDNVYDGPNGGG